MLCFPRRRYYSLFQKDAMQQNLDNTNENLNKNLSSNAKKKIG